MSTLVETVIVITTLTTIHTFSYKFYYCLHTSQLFTRPDGRPPVRVHRHDAERSPSTGENKGVQKQKEEEGQKRCDVCRIKTPPPTR